MSITPAELQMNLSKYLVLAATEDVYITENGKVIAKLTSPSQEKTEIAKSLIGIIPADADTDRALKERRESI